MYIVEEAVGPNGKGHGLIVMREDGSFEGLVYQAEGVDGRAFAKLERRVEDYKVCAEAETFSVVKTLVYEQLGI